MGERESSLTTQIAIAINAFLPRRLDATGKETESSAFARPRVAANCAKAVMAIPEVGRALARDTAIENAELLQAEPFSNGYYRAGYNDLLRHFKAVGVESNPQPEESEYYRLGAINMTPAREAALAKAREEDDDAS